MPFCLFLSLWRLSLEGQSPQRAQPPSPAQDSASGAWGLGLPGLCLSGVKAGGVGRAERVQCWEATMAWPGRAGGGLRRGSGISLTGSIIL